MQPSAASFCIVNGLGGHPFGRNKNIRAHEGAAVEREVTIRHLHSPSEARSNVDASSPLRLPFKENRDLARQS